MSSTIEKILAKQRELALAKKRVVIDPAEEAIRKAFAPILEVWGEVWHLRYRDPASGEMESMLLQIPREQREAKGSLHLAPTPEDCLIIEAIVTKDATGDGIEAGLRVTKSQPPDGRMNTWGVTEEEAIDMLITHAARWVEVPHHLHPKP